MRLTRVRYLLLSSLLVLSAAVYLRRAQLDDRSPPGVKITRSTLDKIHDGMTEAEITATLGVPPGDYTTRPVAGYVALVASDHDVLNPAPRTRKDWVFNWCRVTVSFEDGKAVRVDEFRGVRERSWIEEMLGIRVGPFFEPED